MRVVGYVLRGQMITAEYRYRHKMRYLHTACTQKKRHKYMDSVYSLQIFKNSPFIRSCQLCVLTFYYTLIKWDFHYLKFNYVFVAYLISICAFCTEYGYIYSSFKEFTHTVACRYRRSVTFIIVAINHYAYMHNPILRIKI